MDQTTIKTILNEMKAVVSAGEIKSPAWWCDKGLELLALWQDLKDELTKAEIAYTAEINLLVESFDFSDAKATKMVKGLADVDGKPSVYRWYKYLEGRDKIVKELVMMSKKRASLEGNY